MKKIFVVFLMLAVSISVFALEATVVKTTGKVEVQKGNEWIALKEGDSLQKGSVISTGFKSECQLKIRDSYITVTSLTRMTFEQIVEKPGKDEARIFLDTGSLKSNIKHTQDRRTGFTVRSPVATASVRGTEFEISTAYGTTNVSASAGAVAFYPTTEKEATLSTEEEDSEAPVMPGEGNSASSVAPSSPKGAYTVTKGQAASIDQKGSSQSAFEKAERKSFIAPPATAATTEAKSASVSAPSLTQVTTVTSAPTAKGSLNIKVEFEETNF